MRQRALIDTGDGPPTPEMLAALGDGMDAQWHWSAPALPAKRAKALPPAPADRKTNATGRTKRKYNRPYGGHPADPKSAERPALVLAYLQQTPNQSLSEILNGIGLDAREPGRLGRWNHCMTAMLKARQVDRQLRAGSPSGRTWEYWVI